MQEFFKSTIIAKFIKYLLMVTPLPNVSYLSDYDVMVENNFYLYHGHIYKCTQTGIFNGSDIEYKNHLVCSETLYCDNNLLCTDGLIPYGGKRLAKYKIVEDYLEGQDIIGITELFNSTTSYYDIETHIKLGDYLRLLRSMYGLDLMSLYNCYANYFVDNVDISGGKLKEATNQNYKVTLVPVKFNHTYTITLSTSSTAFIKPVIYDGRLIRDPQNDGFIYDNSYTTITKLSAQTLNNPVYINIANTDPQAQALEKHLYLAIQLPKNNNTPITVLEGEFRNYYQLSDYDFKVFSYAIESDLNKLFLSKSSLLKKTKSLNLDTRVAPFSDRLIEYLVGHTIDVREELSENVKYVTDTFGYRYGYEGSWEPSLRGKLFDNYMKWKDKKPHLNFEDILGYVDKDIEQALLKGYVAYGNKYRI